LTENRPNQHFFVEYAGELLSAAKGNRREQAVDNDSVYRYFFCHDNKEYWLVRWLFNEVLILIVKGPYAVLIYLTLLYSKVLLINSSIHPHYSGIAHFFGKCKLYSRILLYICRLTSSC